MFPDIYRRKLLPQEIQDAYKTLERSRQRKEKEYNSPNPPPAQTPAPEPQEPPATVPEAPTSPAPMVPPPRQNEGNQLTYESIFPDDPIGSLLAQRQGRSDANRS